MNNPASRLRKLFFAFVACIGLSAAAMASDGNSVNFWVLSKFKDNYKGATDVNWMIAPDYVKASFLYEGEKVEAYYTTKGDFIAEAKAIPSEDIPRAAKKIIQKQYSRFRMTQVIEYSTNEKVEYFVSLENDVESKVLKISVYGDVEVFKTMKK